MRYFLYVLVSITSLLFLFPGSLQAQSNDKSYEIIEITPKEGFSLPNLILANDGNLIGSFNADGRETYSSINQKTHLPIATAMEYLNGQLSTKYIDEATFAGSHQIDGPVRVIYFPDGVLQVINVKASKDNPFHLIRVPLTDDLKWLIQRIATYLQTDLKEVTYSGSDRISAYGVLSIGHVTSSSRSGFFYLLDPDSIKQE